MSARLKDAAPALSGRLPNPALAGFVPRLVNGVLELPSITCAAVLRPVSCCGTSTARELALREEAIRWIMGVPPIGEVKGNRQTTGLGRGPSTSNKVFIVDRSRPPTPISRARLPSSPPTSPQSTGASTAATCRLR